MPNKTVETKEAHQKITLLFETFKIWKQFACYNPKFRSPKVLFFTAGLECFRCNAKYFRFLYVKCYCTFPLIWWFPHIISTLLHFIRYSHETGRKTAKRNNQLKRSATKLLKAAANRVLFPYFSFRNPYTVLSARNTLDSIWVDSLDSFQMPIKNISYNPFLHKRETLGIFELVLKSFFQIDLLNLTV